MADSQTENRKKGRHTTHIYSLIRPLSKHHFTDISAFFSFFSGDFNAAAAAGDPWIGRRRKEDWRWHKEERKRRHQKNRQKKTPKTLQIGSVFFDLREKIMGVHTTSKILRWYCATKSAGAPGQWSACNCRVEKSGKSPCVRRRPCQKNK